MRRLLPLMSLICMCMYTSGATTAITWTASPPLYHTYQRENGTAAVVSQVYVCMHTCIYTRTQTHTHTHTHTHINTHTYIHTRTHTHTHTHTYIAMRDHERRGAALMRSIGSSSPFANENGASQPTPGAEERAQSASSKPHPTENRFYSQEASTASRGRCKV